MTENIDNDKDSQKVDYANETFDKVFRGKRCGCCEKVFSRIDWVSYAYKIHTAGNTVYFCSWTCLQKYRRAKEAAKLKKPLAVATDAEMKKRPKYKAKRGKRSNKPF